LCARGHRAVIGAFHKPLLEEAAARGFPTVRIPRGLALPGGVRAVARDGREHAIDDVNAHSIRMTALAGLARGLKLVSPALVTTIHNVVDRRNDRLAYPILRRFPDELVFVSQYERERLAEVWGSELGQVIYSGVELPRPGAVEPLDLEAAHGIPKDARVLGFVGRLSAEKAVGDAITALGAAARRTCGCASWAPPRGGGAVRARAPARAGAARGVRASARGRALHGELHGAGADLPARESSPSRVARPARWPCRWWRRTGVREIVAPLRTGLLYPSGDVDGLVRALRVLLEDPSRAAAWGCAAREHVAQTVSVKRWVDETEALFARVARAT
jgi:glycosyltransferase involved in cell wall biosynthesis